MEYTKVSVRIQVEIVVLLDDIWKKDTPTANTSILINYKINLFYFS